MILSCPLSPVLGVILLNESHGFAFRDQISTEKSKMNATHLCFVLCAGSDHIE